AAVRRVRGQGRALRAPRAARPRLPGRHAVGQSARDGRRPEDARGARARRRARAPRGARAAARARRHGVARGARRLAGRVRAPRFAVLARVRDAYRAAHRRSGARRRGGALRTLLPRLPRALRLPRAVGLRGRLPVERAHRSRRRPCRRGLRRGAHGDLRAMSTSCSVRRGDPGGAFLATARGEPASRRPVWIMRQAGRHLPEYRALRERHAFLELCETPELAAAATLQPLERYDLDAAILFTDLLVPVVPMGVGLAYEPGPVLERTIRDRAAVESLRIPDPQEE